ncbi:MAG: thioredoxin family protein [Chloroflexi bacterium]|nr:thioredoxin family protein [Chloroflexota bacterium]MCL5273942.1 thioredoxin family protein [Chloroflexota bacterium]
MIERLLILLSLAFAAAAIWSVVRWWKSRKLNQLRNEAPLSKLAPPGIPAVVAFSAPHCRDCHTLQEPALARLKAKLREQVTVTSVSALDHLELVAHLGILTVPSTVVLDAKGTVQQINLGYASDTKLYEQLAGLPGRSSPKMTARTYSDGR